MLGGLIFLVSLLGGAAVGRQSGAAGFASILTGAIAAAGVGLNFWLAGVLISAQGQVLLATLDAAVNHSPFLTDDERAVAMSLPDATEAGGGAAAVATTPATDSSGTTASAPAVRGHSGVPSERTDRRSPGITPGATRDAKQVWRRKSDEELREAEKHLNDYTESGKRIILAEIRRRGIHDQVPIEEKDVGSDAAANGSPAAESDVEPFDFCYHCGAEVVAHLSKCPNCGKEI